MTACRRRERVLAMAAIALAMTMAVLDGAIVNVALPVMAKDLAVRPADAIFVVNAYQIAVTASLLPFAALGDIFGFRKVYLPGLAVFVAASLACAVAPSLPLLIAARIVQGLGAAAIMSVNIGFVRFIYPHRMIGQGVANVALVVAVASAAGPTVAAAILSVATWPWLFLVNIPVGLLALAVASRTLPATPASGRPFDFVSAVLNALTFGLLIIGIDGLGDPEGRPVAIAELVGALVIGAVFVRRQMRLPAPLLPVDLLRIPAFALSMATSVASFCAQMISYVALPFYFQDVLHLSSTQTGFLLTPWPIAVAAMAPVSGRLADRYPPGILGGIGLAHDGRRPRLRDAPAGRARHPRHRLAPDPVRPRLRPVPVAEQQGDRHLRPARAGRRGQRDAVDGAAHRPVPRRGPGGGDLRPDPRARRRSGP